MSKSLIFCLLTSVFIVFNSHASSITVGSESIIEKQGVKNAGKTVAKIMVAKSI